MYEDCTGKLVKKPSFRHLFAAASLSRIQGTAGTTTPTVSFFLPSPRAACEQQPAHVLHSHGQQPPALPCKHEQLSGMSKQPHLAKHERSLANKPRRDTERSVTSGAHCGSTGIVLATIHATLRQRLTPLATDELRLDTAHALSSQSPAKLVPHARLPR